ncbi:hypothetical protein [Hymenobacter weizhouensis]|uniref:hypothetical protein n=1 Tax=Hymenobacter sp. YIM 151500-1 TaxID=2987689 RepID=UPI0022262D32|nr:hypothetical protein [Hymenobacter sp. YIM 151500-1]UYZ64856.1 hypothetical protein OIS53_08400 [Hymenobacter sp. YIM 151500-1]
MQAPTFRAWVRPCPRFGFVWQLRQPFYSTTANGERPTRAAAMREAIRDARHFQTCHAEPEEGGEVFHEPPPPWAPEGYYDDTDY